MTWLLVIWLIGDPGSTGTISHIDEASCQATLKTWGDISDKHSGICIYGNSNDLNLGQFEKSVSPRS